MKPGEFVVNVAEDASLDRRTRLAIKAALRLLAGDVARITIEKWRSTRSNQQNRWYWGVVLDALSEHTGYTPEECHDLCKRKFLPKTLALSDGNGVVVEELVIGGSTTKLNTQQMAQYCDDIRDWAASEFGLLIADPDPDWREAEKERAA